MATKAYSKNPIHVTLGNAGADLSAKQGFAVKLHTDGTVILCGAGEPGFILVNEPASGEPAQVAVGGIEEGICGAAVNPGVKVMADGSGEFVACTAGNDSIGIYVGTSAAADGDWGAILVTPGAIVET